MATRSEYIQELEDKLAEVRRFREEETTRANALKAERDAAVRLLKKANDILEKCVELGGKDKARLLGAEGGLRLCIGMHTNTPWPDVRQEDVDGYMRRWVELTGLRGGGVKPQDNAVLRELVGRTESFWAYLQGEHGVELSLSELEGEHNVSGFFEALAAAKAALRDGGGVQKEEVKGDG